MSTGTSWKTEKNYKNELQWHCEEVYTGQDETKKSAREKMSISTRKVTGTSRRTEEEQRSQLIWCCRPRQRCLTTRSTDLKAQMLARYQAVVFGEDFQYYKGFSGTGPDGGTKFVEDREAGVLAKTRCRTKKEIRSYRAIALTSVMSKWYASCIILRLQEGKEPEGCKKLHVGRIDGISCQHLQK